jgi:hypothetical protein
MTIHDAARIAIECQDACNLSGVPGSFKVCRLPARSPRRMRTTNTRRQKAAELLRLATNGPSFSAHADGSAFTVEEAARQFKNWSESWVKPLMDDLVPELQQTFQSP